MEAHGTGTTLGDPIEAQALLATYGQDRETPLLLGSIKSNIGHTQSAAGVAGVIKMVKALEHGVLPETLHVTEPSSHVDWSAGAIEVLTGPAEWPPAERARRAAVSSFGISGTNVHLILEQAPAADEPTLAAPVPVVPWVLSGRSARCATCPGRPPAVSCGRAGARRTSGSRWRRPGRCSSTAPSIVGDLRAARGVDAVSRGEPSAAVVEGVADVDGRTVFVFPGQGAQWVGMGARLLDESPVFAERLAECAAALSSFVDWSLLDVLREGRELDRVDVVQPASFAVMVAFAAVWESYGVSPDAVVGHSQGEIAAAVVAGALSLEDGARVVALRSKAIARTLAGRGGMMSVALPVAEVESRLGPELSVAAVNGPGSVVVAGEPEALDVLFDELTGEGVRVRRIPVDYASHSAHVELLHDELLAELGSIEPGEARGAVLLHGDGEWVDGTGLDAGYWYRNLRQRVEFEPAIRALLAAEHRVFVEVSPHPVLTMAVQETAAGHPVVATGTLRRDEGDLARFLTSAAELFVRGVPVDWHFGTGRRVDLPTYAFQRELYWPDAPEDAPAADPADTEFWRALRETDPGSLADELDVDTGALESVLPALDAWRGKLHAESTVDSWQYRVDWKPLSLPETGSLPGTWLVVTPAADPEWAAAVIAALGAQTVSIALDSTDRETVASRLRAAAGGSFAGVLSFLALDETDTPAAPGVPAGLLTTTALLQAMGDAGLDAPLWSLTRRAVSVDARDELAGPLQGGVWGFGRVAALEYPDRWGGLVDLPDTVDRRVARRLTAVLTGDDGEDQVAVRAAGAFGRRIVRLAAPARGEWRAAGTVLVTGGTGALGGHVARLLAGAGAEHLLLTSRRGADAPGAAALRDELAATGVRVSIVACDAADRAALAEVLAGVPADLPLTGVVHTAGVLDDGLIDGLTPDRFEQVFAAKVTAARHLDELTRDLDLSMFVLYGSAAGALGSRGQANYAAANAVLDGIAVDRRAVGLPATTVSWGLWAGSGLAAGTAAQAQGGVVAMDPLLASSALPRVVLSGEPAPLVYGVDWAEFAPGFLALRRSALLMELPEVRRAVAAAREAERERRDRPTELQETAAPDVPGRPGGVPARPRARTGRRRAALPRPGRGRAGQGVQGARLRLDHRGRAGQPARREDQPEPAGHPGVRLPLAARARRAPARQDRRHRRRRRPGHGGGRAGR